MIAGATALATFGQYRTSWHSDCTFWRRRRRGARLSRPMCPITIRATCRWCDRIGVRNKEDVMAGLVPAMTRSKVRETTHETIRPHRKAARHQARQRLELEIHLRKDRRLFRSPDRRRHPRPDEIDETASRQCRRAVRAVQIRDRDAQ